MDDQNNSVDEAKNLGVPSTESQATSGLSADPPDMLRDHFRRLRGEVEAFWTMLYRCFDIEPRSYFETEAPKNGFEYATAMACFFMWKRKAKADVWLPIETAPKDGTQLLLLDADNIPVVGFYGKHNHVPIYGWVRPVELYGEEVDGFDATHWLPLPAAPITQVAATASAHSTTEPNPGQAS